MWVVLDATVDGANVSCTYGDCANVDCANMVCAVVDRAQCAAII